MLITCSYRDQEFVRVGYYVNNELEIDPATQSMLTGEEPIPVPTQMTPEVVARLNRNILAYKPRVTRFPIRWDVIDELAPPVQSEVSGEILQDEVDDDFIDSSLHDAEESEPDSSNLGNYGKSIATVADGDMMTEHQMMTDSLEHQPISALSYSKDSGFDSNMAPSA